jgi:hypothetical protein
VAVFASFSGVNKIPDNAPVATPANIPNNTFPELIVLFYKLIILKKDHPVLNFTK